jgi:two-component system, OmpR family, sensor kinase
MSLRTRLLVAFAYVLAIVIVALEVPLALNLSRRVSAEVKSESQGQAQLLAASISGRLDDPRALRSLVSRAAGDLGGRVLVVDVRGRLVVDSAGSGLGTRSYASRPEIGRALAGRTEQGIRHSNSLDEDLLVTAVPVVHAGRREGAVRVTQSVAAVQSEIRRDIVALIGVGAVALLFGLAVAWLLARSLVRPLEALACTARQVAGGDLDARAEEAGSREQRQLAAAFNEMTARLARALRAQREFVANASHQLRTPLTGLRLRLESAALKIRDRAAEPDLGAAERETERLAKLLDELLTLATERERPRAQRLALADAVAAARERWEASAAASGHALRLRGEGDPVVDATEDDLAAILDNLIANALEYSPAHTAVTVSWGVAGRWVSLAVLDEGPGIDPAERERLFERFFRGSAGRGGSAGTGLGLSVVEALAQRWGGSATLDTRDGGGARAEIRLPASPSPGLRTPNPQLDEALPGPA